nr:serine palmitoyltransferase 1 [Ciona intestinalis]|eukprot:XP_026690315.1 serine palmitoyltransferase 1 [Ciona intestinalis]
MSVEYNKPKEWVFAEAIHSMYQAPLYHLILEGLLLVWIFRLLFFKSYKIQNKIPLSKKEKDDLVKEWTPEPLVPDLQKTLSLSTPYKEITGRPGKMITVDGKECLNLASMNFLGLLGNERIAEKSSASIRKYGVGACGPRAFYGTVDVHVELEERLAEYMESERAISYAYGFATIASAIPAYSKRGDIIFVDEAVCFAIQKGLHASRSNIVYFRHNDLDDLEEKLKIQANLDKKDPKKASVTRKFMVVEGIYMNTGEICDLPRLVDLKYKYKVRLFVEESLSFGVLGQHGRGVTEHYNIPIDKVDLVVGSMEYALASIGGFCCGRGYVIDHQRLSGHGYVFSASLPPLLARAAVEGLDILQDEPEIFNKIRAKGKLMQELMKEVPELKISGFYESPSFHIRRKSTTNQSEDEKFLKVLVDQCYQNGVCLSIASRLSHEEHIADWPASIRVSVSVEMSDDEIKMAAHVIQQAARYAEQQI